VSAPLRVAGWGTLDDGAAITWTVAQGRRGRRWREVVAIGDDVRHSLLLETDADGRFNHLELARAGGLWTFHPEPDGTLHGNHVDPGTREVHHVAGLRFAPDDLLVIEGSPLGAAAIAWRVSTVVAEAASATFAGIVLPLAGPIMAEPTIRVERLGATRWRIGDGPPFDVSADGLPILADGETRPLELG
jgi:hypothetical protein